MVLKAGIHFLRVMSFLRLLHLRWVICHIVALACLLVDLLGIGLHHLKNENSCLVDHCFTSHYSFLWDVQIDRILHTLVTYSRSVCHGGSWTVLPNGGCCPLFCGTLGPSVPDGFGVPPSWDAILMAALSSPLSCGWPYTSALFANFPLLLVLCFLASFLASVVFWCARMCGLLGYGFSTSLRVYEIRSI